MIGFKWLLAMTLAVSIGPVTAIAAETCAGKNLFDDMPPQRLASLRAAADAAPFARGNFWRAEKGPNRITVIGTYHFDDPRHDPTIARFRETVENADALLVEAGPKEMARLTDALKTRPELIVQTEGPTLPERMEPEDWQKLTEVLKARNIPAVMAARMRPWFVAMSISVSPCLMRQAAANGQVNGLDQRLMDIATEAQVPITALEPWDTAFRLFSDLTPEQEIDTLLSAIPAAEMGDDYTATLAHAYFTGESRLLWEFSLHDAYTNSSLTRAEVDEYAAMAEAQLIERRNESWMEPLTAAADEAGAKGKGIVAAFGSLHLSGESGVLKLLEEDGYTLTRLAVDAASPEAPAPPNGG